MTTRAQSEALRAGVLRLKQLCRYSTRVYLPADSWLEDAVRDILALAQPAQAPAGMTEGHVDAPHGERDMWVAAIDIQGHGSAVECYGPTEAAARALRDAILRSPQPEAQPYTDAIGKAGQEYMRRFEPYAHPLPALFRWEELWNAMNAAQPEARDRLVLHAIGEELWLSERLADGTIKPVRGPAPMPSGWVAAAQELLTPTTPSTGGDTPSDERCPTCGMRIGACGKCHL